MVVGGGGANVPVLGDFGRPPGGATTHTTHTGHLGLGRGGQGHETQGKTDQLPARGVQLHAEIPFNGNGGHLWSLGTRGAAQAGQRGKSNQKNISPSHAQGLASVLHWIVATTALFAPRER
jgi:hypothetical protein